MKDLLIRSSVVGIIALLVLGAAGCSPKSTQGESLGQISPALSTNITSSMNAQGEGPDVKLEADIKNSGVTESVKSLDTTLLDGSSLVQIHCAKCHSVRVLEMTEKPRADWEKILSRMERTNVHLSDTERSALLDHLASPDKP